MATTRIDGLTYLFVSGIIDNVISIFSVTSSGELINTANIVDDEALKINQPVSLTTAIIDETTYLFVIGQSDNGVSVFRLKKVYSNNFKHSITSPTVFFTFTT